MTHEYETFTILITSQKTGRQELFKDVVAALGVIAFSDMETGNKIAVGEVNAMAYLAAMAREELAHLAASGAQAYADIKAASAEEKNN